MTVRSVNIDALLYTYTAFGGALITYLSTDDSYKYIDPITRFWTIAIVGSSISGLNALKAFRSQTYGRLAEQQQKEKDAKENSVTNGPAASGS